MRPHRRVGLRHAWQNDGSWGWMAFYHVCPVPYVGAGLGSSPEEAFVNARIGFGNAVTGWDG